MSPPGITALLLAAVVAFAWFTARKLRIVMALAPEARWDQPWSRLRTVLDNGFLQRRMIRREARPGVMHTVIFLGFMSLLVRKAQLVMIGFDATYALTGPLGDVFTVWLADGIVRTSAACAQAAAGRTSAATAAANATAPARLTRPERLARRAAHICERLAARR